MIILHVKFDERSLCGKVLILKGFVTKVKLKAHVLHQNLFVLH